MLAAWPTYAKILSSGGWLSRSILEMTPFNSWRDFAEFESQVRTQRRYIRTEEGERFLDGIRSTLPARISKFSKGRLFWRAQIGHDWREIVEINDSIPAAFPPARMKPLADRAMEGRANPKGIPMLYLCTNKDAAMSEVRPWIGTLVSLGQFEIIRDLRLVDCTRVEVDRLDLLFESESSGRIDVVDAVWSEINRAFTKPVTRSDDLGEYVATQILVEFFRSENFDGIIYRSAFGERSQNLALFELKDAELVSCQLYEATSVRMNFQDRDNPYWVRRSKEGPHRR